MHGPPESLLFKASIEKPESIIVPVEDLDFVPQAVTENKQMTREGIGLQHILNQYHQSIDRFSHIRGTGCEIDPGVRAKGDHSDWIT